ncbi:MAG: T9SS type B sorting domain-containing protein [Bacteroidia bacterium]
MKKPYLSLLMVCLCFLGVAQEDKHEHPKYENAPALKVYEYPSQVLTEEKIATLVEESRKSGTSASELEMFNKILHAKMQKQQKDYLYGTSTAQRNGPMQVNSTACVNPGFENGTNSNWTFASADINGVTLPCNTCPTGTSAINQVVTNTTTIAGQCSGGIDSYGGFPVVFGGNYSLVLNDANYMGKMQEASYTYVVDPSSTIYTFDYAAVLNSGGHAANANPYFHVAVTNNTTGSVIGCTQYTVSAPASGTLPGWSISPQCGGNACNTVYYRTWTTVSVDLSAQIGNTVTISYIVSDCANGGHFGYVYLDGDCSTLNVTNNASICSGASANLCGPPGYSGYNWTGPVTGSSQCLSTTTPGTYTLNMTSSTSCPAPTLQYSVTSNPAATPGFTSTTTPCSLVATFTDTSTPPSGGSISGWTWNYGDGQSSTSTTLGNTQTHTYAATGTYTVVMTNTTSAGCVGTASTVVNLTSMPLTVASSSVLCTGSATGSATVHATGGPVTPYTYTWTGSSSVDSVATNLSPGTYTVSVSSGSNCTNTISVVVANAPAITSTQTITDAYCNLPNGGATVIPSGGSGGYTYAWSPTGGNTGTLSGAATGVYTLTVHDSNGCTYTTTANVGNLPGVSITSISSTSVSCYNGADGTASGVATGSSPTYTWMPGGSNFPNITGLSPNTYTLYVGDSHGCKDTATVAVANATQITATSSITATPCGGTLGSATVTPSGGAAGYTYTWSPAPASGNLNNVQNLSSGNYNCVVTDANGCTKTVSIFITTTTGPTVTAVQTASVTCNGLSDGQASVVTVNGGTAPLSYTWLPGPVSTNSVTSGIPAGTWTVIVQDASGCFGSDTAVVVQPAPFSLPVVTGTVSCNIVNANPSFPNLTTDGSAAVNGSGGTLPWTYNWQNSSGITVSTNSATASNLPVGTYTCYITDGNGCTTHTVAVINSPTPLTAPVTTTSVSCNPANTGNSTNGATSTAATGGTAGYFYTWSPLVGSPGANLNSSYGNLPAGTYSLHVTDSKNCIYDDNNVVIAGPPAISATGTVTPILCNGGKGTATVDVTPVGSYTYAWTPSGGSNNVASNLSGTTAGTNYTCTVTNVNSCKTTYTMTLTQPSKITGTITAVNPNCAGGANGSLTGNLTNGTPISTGPPFYTYTWTPGNMNTQTISGLPAGTYTLVAQDANGCTFTKVKTLTAPEPVDTLEATGTLCSTDPEVTLSAPTGGTAPDDITGYQWYLNTTAITGANSSTYNANQSTINNYAVTWIYHGCIHTTKTIVENILPDLGTIPQTNIFTPNDDKKNDEFYPFSLINNLVLANYSVVNSMLKSYNLIVYDRWGKKMYETSDIMKPWDGKTLGGHDAPDGTYYWIVNYQSHCNNGEGIKKIKGFVQLLR